MVTALDFERRPATPPLAADAELAARLDRHIAWLTAGGRVGYRELARRPREIGERADGQMRKWARGFNRSGGGSCHQSSDSV